MAMAPHSSTLAWKIPPAWWAAVHGVTRLSDFFHFSLSCTGEGNGNPLQCSCLENPRGGGASWAAVYGVTQSRTRLKRLSSKTERMFTVIVLYWRPSPAQWVKNVKQKKEISRSLITDNTLFCRKLKESRKKAEINKWILQVHKIKSQYKNQFSFCILATNHRKLTFKAPFIIA